MPALSNTTLRGVFSEADLALSPSPAKAAVPLPAINSRVLVPACILKILFIEPDTAMYTLSKASTDTLSTDPLATFKAVADMPSVNVVKLPVAAGSKANVLIRHPATAMQAR